MPVGHAAGAGVWDFGQLGLGHDFIIATAYNGMYLLPHTQSHTEIPQRPTSKYRDLMRRLLAYNTVVAAAYAGRA
jgi:hypothetical protein